MLLPAYPNTATPEECLPFATALLEWYAAHQRPLPWRETPDAYRVWISEIMLQQTQMERGVAYFTQWMQRFPSLASLAAAPLDDVLKAWEGLGYYSRAKNLHAAARHVQENLGGVLPSTPEGMLALPGVGRYTAGAVCSIAHNLPVPAVDANVERVFSRLFDVDAPSKSKEAQAFFWQAAQNAIPHGQARHMNQALMELGALVCAKRARCTACPLLQFCQANYLDLTFERPITGAKMVYVPLQIVTGVLVHRGRVFVQKRLDHGAWAGLWEFPGGSLEEGETPEQAVVREFSEETDFTPHILHPLGTVRHAYTRYRITLHGFVCTLPGNPQGYPDTALHAATECRWATLDELDTLAFPAGHRKLLDTKKTDIIQALDPLSADPV